MDVVVGGFHRVESLFSGNKEGVSFSSHIIHSQVKEFCMSGDGFSRWNKSRVGLITPLVVPPHQPSPIFVLSLYPWVCRRVWTLTVSRMVNEVPEVVLGWIFGVPYVGRVERLFWGLRGLRSGWETDRGFTRGHFSLTHRDVYRTFVYNCRPRWDILTFFRVYVLLKSCDGIFFFTLKSWTGPKYVGSLPLY